MQPPTGTVTFLFTDIEGSSRLWERYPVDMGPALARHDAILRGAIEAHGGFVFKTVGDAFCAAFGDAMEALRSTLVAQRALFAEDWGAVGPLRVRMGLHVGPAEFRDGDYFGGTLNRVARISSAGHGGQILVSHALAEALGTVSEAGFQSLGDFRLRNLHRVERIFQANADGLPQAFPPLRSPKNLPHNLPAATSSLIGRARELEQVKEAVSSARVLTLTGTGGTGKTRLALEAARELLEDYPDGVWLVELATLDTGSGVVDALAAVLEVREEPGRPLRESLCATLAGRNALLVLDNCEHLLDEVARNVSALLECCPKLRVLATSRQPLHVRGETTVPVRPLPALDIWKRPRDRAITPEDLEAFPAVQLFVERARGVIPGFALTEANAADVARICWRLDGIPLAIELAAARLRVLAPAQIAARLNDQFRLLKGGDQTTLPHQQTLRTLIDWSYDLLGGPERVLFQRLGVFAGGRTLESIESICAGGPVDEDDILDLLQSLADKSLIFMESDEEGTRFTLLESVWQYAREKLQADGEFDELRDRHLAHFLSLADDASPHLFGPDPGGWLRRLSAEALNLRFALEWAAERPGSAEAGLRMIASLCRHWEICGNLEEARRHIEAILARPDCDAFPLWHARAMAGAGRIAWAQDRYEDGQVFLDRAMQIFSDQGRKDELGQICGSGGFLAWSSGNRQKAIELFDRAGEIGSESGDRRLLAMALAGRGTIAAAGGDLEGALEIKRQALEMFRSIGDKWTTGYSLWGVAQVALALGQAAEAREALREWAAIASELGNRWATPYILQHLADAARIEGNAELSARIFGISEKLRGKFGLSFTPSEQMTWDASVEALRKCLPPESLQTLWNAGAHLRPESALEIALQG